MLMGSLRDSDRLAHLSISNSAPQLLRFLVFSPFILFYVFKIVHVWQEYYQLLQSLTQQNAEVASQPPKAAQEASQASESTHENREPSASTLPSTGVEHWQQSGSDPNGHAPTPTADVAVDPSPWSNESPQRHVSPPPSTGNVEGEVPPPHVFEDDPNSQIDSTIDYPITPGFEDGVGDY